MASAPSRSTDCGLMVVSCLLQAPPERVLVWVGDSLTAGFGARGSHPPCEINQFTDSNYVAVQEEGH